MSGGNYYTYGGRRGGGWLHNNNNIINSIKLLFVVALALMGILMLGTHRELFYQQCSMYDLFIYTEDDHWLRPKHVWGYLEETRKLQQRLGHPRYLDYAIGFLRYEEEDEEVEGEGEGEGDKGTKRNGIVVATRKKKIIW